MRKHYTQGRNKKLNSAVRWLLSFPRESSPNKKLTSAVLWLLSFPRESSPNKKLNSAVLWLLSFPRESSTNCLTLHCDNKKKLSNLI